MAENQILIKALRKDAMESHSSKKSIDHPGGILENALADRGWSQSDLAQILQRPLSTINEIVRGVKSITPETAIQLEAVLGIPAAEWLKAEADYRLWLARKQPQPSSLERKGRLYQLAPVSDLLKRGWITEQPTIDLLETEVFRFLGIESYDQTTHLDVCCRTGNADNLEVKSLAAWARRVEAVVHQQQVSPYSHERLRQVLTDISYCAARVELAANVPSLLARAGIKFAIVPHLPQTYLDGATWEVDGSPIIALTLRRDRIDSFWFTLFHELAHIVCKHKGPQFDNMEDDQRISDQEKEADKLARNILVNDEALQRFIRQTSPYFSKVKIERFAASQGRHPGIVLGRLQREGVVEYSHLRALLVSVRQYMQPWIDTPVVTKGGSS